MKRFNNKQILKPFYVLTFKHKLVFSKQTSWRFEKRRESSGGLGDRQTRLKSSP